jgi:hypothetical protein
LKQGNFLWNDFLEDAGIWGRSDGSMVMKMAHTVVKKGDILYADRGLYKHYGVYNHDGSVVHFSPDKGAEISAKNAYIRETTLAEFLKGDELHIDRTFRAVFSPEEIVRRARRFVNELRGNYNLLSLNCEHFARWCATGELESKQVKKGVAIVGTIAATAVAAVLIGTAIADRKKSEDEQG